MIQFRLKIAKTIFYTPYRHLLQWKRYRLQKSPWNLGDNRLKETFLNDSIPEQERYSELFSYFVSGFLYYRSPDLGRAYYPGLSSSHGADIDAMEGFCRVLPMIGTWVASGRRSIIQGIDGQDINLIEIAKSGLLAGTNPKSKGYWGNIHNHDQRIVEAADVALSIWLLREYLWPQLSLSEKDRVVNWLLMVNRKKISDNNWHLFPVIINEVLYSLGYSDGDHKLARMHYERLKSFYQGGGWFFDGPNGPYDYYNAWGIHYALFWLNLINPSFDPDFIDSSLNDFVRSYKYFFSPNGIPITGRSICYRMAAPVPLVAAVAKKLDCIGPGMARRALDCVWKYFISQGAVRYGNVTQGYWLDDANLLDYYSGPASGLWSIRSLVLAFYCPPNSDFWTAPLEKLPIEQADYRIFIPEIQWEIRGYKLTGEVQIIKVNNANNTFKEVEKYTIPRKIAGFILCTSFRPHNCYIKYHLHQYSSLHPFGGNGNS